MSDGLSSVRSDGGEVLRHRWLALVEQDRPRIERAWPSTDIAAASRHGLPGLKKYLAIDFTRKIEAAAC
jgi:hypothetical protein